MKNDSFIRLDLSNSVFQDVLFSLQKAERLVALDTLKKLLQITWSQLYVDKEFRWEKVTSIKSPKGISALYSLKITKSCRATAFRDGDTLRFLTIYFDHDATYGKSDPIRLLAASTQEKPQVRSGALWNASSVGEISLAVGEDVDTASVVNDNARGARTETVLRTRPVGAAGQAGRPGKP
jgi:hypothetical protein